MVALPQSTDPTLDAVDAAIEAKANTELARPYLGMSAIGKACRRALWYSFRWCSDRVEKAEGIKRIEDGHRGEDVQADRLRLVPGLVLRTVDPRTDRQFGFADLGGHFRGHADGMIEGILQAPKTEHVWEHKQVGEKKQAALEKARLDQGEKGALKAWDAVYYAQALLYMHYSGLRRHYLTAASPGGRRTVSVRTNADNEAANKLIEKARVIIAADGPLERLSERPDWYECKWCEHHSICHGDALPKVTCRTCLHATPELDGDGRWSCARFGCDLPTDHQRRGDECPEHRYIPALIRFAEPVDASEADNWVAYQVAEDAIVKNGGDGYSSIELRALGAHLVVDPEVDALKKPLAGDGRNLNQNPPQSPARPWSPAAPANTSSQTPSATVPASAVAPWTVRAQA